MAKGIHKSTELHNVSETWDQNERLRATNGGQDDDAVTGSELPAGNSLEQAIKEEAAEYDNDNKENRVLGGDRASVNDDASAAE
jgi:hypothetical protein